MPQDTRCVRTHKAPLLAFGFEHNKHSLVLSDDRNLLLDMNRRASASV